MSGSVPSCCLPVRPPWTRTPGAATAAAEPGAQAIGGFGVKAVCVFEPQVTPPSTTILVLLHGSRIYRATATYEYCDTVQRFARTAINRIPG